MAHSHHITNLGHVAIVVADLDAAVDFYQNVLGLRVSHRESQSERGLDIAFIPIGTTQLELIAPQHDQSEVSAFLEKRGGGLHHVSFDVEHAQSSFEHLKSQNIRMISERVEPGAHGCQVAFIHPKSALGTLVELSEPPQKD